MNFSHSPNAKFQFSTQLGRGLSGDVSRLEEAEPFFQIGLVGRIDLCDLFLQSTSADF
jgi:hypothetical protein